MTDRAMKICIITNALSLGGSERQLLRICNAVTLNDAEIEIIYYAKPHTLLKEFEKSPAKITFIDRDKIGKIKFIFHLAKYLKQGNFDVIHCWRGTANHYGALAAIISKHKRILTGYRNITPVPFPLRIFDKAIQRFTVGRIVNSNIIKKFQIEHLKYSSNKISVLFNGIDIEEFAQDFDRDKIKEDLGINKELPVIVSIGRLVYPKRHDLLIEAALLLKNSGCRAEYLIVGDGPHKNNLLDLVQRYDLKNNIHFTGAREDIADLLAISDISVCCSISEGFPNVILESMASGVAVITTDNGGGSEMIHNPDQIVPVDDVQALAKKVMFLLDNEDVRRKWGDSARQLAQEKYSIDLIASQYVELLRRAYRHG